MNIRQRTRLTVVLPVRNEARYIESTLQQLCAQTLSPEAWEAIVVDGHSDDGTSEMVERFIAANPEYRLRLERNPSRLSSAARNIALRKGHGDYFLIIDAHVHIPNAKLLEASLKLASEHQARCLGRPQPLEPPGINDFQRTVALARTSPLAHSTASYIYGNHRGFVSPESVATMYSRGLIEAIGEFDETFDAAEDVEYNTRIAHLGVDCYIAPELAVFYYPRENHGQLFRQLVRYGRGRTNLVAKHPRSFKLEMLVPAGILASFLLAAPVSVTALTLGWKTLALLNPIPLVIYLSTCLLEGLRLGRGQPRKSLLLTSIIITIHLGLGYGMIAQLVKGRRSRTRN